jgi:NAD(P)-dependent dehydrogenase (short-subunit alcohol dehydrogenase family)
VELGLANSRVIITGGASNIGRAIVHALAEESAQLAILDRDVTRAEATAREARARGAPGVHVFAVDLLDRAASRAAIAAATAALGGVDTLVANVGSNKPAFFLDTPEESWTERIELNLMSCMTCAHAVLPAMLAQQRGAIVAIASTAAFGEPRQSVYAAAKAGVIGFVRTLALEYGRYGIRANLVAPGLVVPEREAIGEGSLWREREAIMNDEQIDYVRRGTPLRRLSTADDIARSVVFLASERASRQLTGQLITVAGGFAMR